MSKGHPWSEGLAEALVVAGRTTEQNHSRKEPFEKRLETFFDAFCMNASQQWFKCCAQADKREERSHDD